MKDIFQDGEIVNTIHIPDDLVSDLRNKKLWGKQVLGDYIVRFHGHSVRNLVSPSGSYDGSLTGTKAIIRSGNKVIIYMIVEPLDKYRQEIHIVKLTEEPEEGSEIDIMSYTIESKKQKKPLGSPFAVLQEVRDHLPRKKKEAGPVGKMFRW